MSRYPPVEPAPEDPAQMMSFSPDPQVAEQQMRAIIFYLTAFGYIDGSFDPGEKSFIRDYIERLVEERAKEALGDDLEDNRDLVARWTAHFEEVFSEIDQE